MKVDNIKIEKIVFVFSVGRVGFSPTAVSEFGLRHWPSVLRDVVYLHGPSPGAA